MRSLGRSLKRLILAPIRLVTLPFRRFNAWLSYEPEETSTAEAIGRSLSQPSLLIEHLTALRGHLMRSVAVFLIATMICLSFGTFLIDWLAGPIGGIEALQAIEVTESISAYMRVALLAGFAISFPYIAIEAFLFINPGLKRRERLVILASVPISALLFLMGLAFAFFLMLPTALPFLLNFGGITTIPRPANYIRFVTGVMFWMGVAFQTPLLVYLLAMLGVVTSQALRKGWRIAIVGIAAVAAIITPTVDPINMGLVMGPMIVLYFLSILAAMVAERGRLRRQLAEAMQAPAA
jgi:sec-independent protein translocase protein TatC